MPTFLTMALPPPLDFSEFEDLCCDIWKRIWRDPNAQRNGRRGQGQNGVDVFGRRDGLHIEGLQCRTKDQMTGSTLAFSEIEQVVREAESFKPPLTAFTIATTAPRDSKLQEQVRQLTTVRVEGGGFPVSVWFWEDIRTEVAAHVGLLRKYYPQLNVNESNGSQEGPVQSVDIEEYLEHLRADVSRDLDPWVVLPMTGDIEEPGSDQMAAMLRSGESLTLIGPSGSGKSHIVRHLSLHLSNEGCLPIIVRPKYYSGNISNFLDEEIVHLTGSSSTALVSGCNAAKIPVILVLDGINETDAAMREDLLKKVQIGLRGGIDAVVVTTRHEYEIFNRLKSRTLRVSLPGPEQREVLEEAYSVSTEVAGRWSDVLRTPLDFKLAGEIAGQSNDRLITQFGFLQAYFEKKLSGRDEESFGLLSWAASQMSVRLSWTLPRADLHRAARENGWPRELLVELQDNCVLAESHEQVSFWHERFQHFFLAEHLLTVNESAENLAAECARPRNRDSVPFLLGALGDNLAVRDCLASVPWKDVYLEALCGALGPWCKAVLDTQAKDLFLRAQRKLRQLKLEPVFSEDGVFRDVSAVSSEDLSAQDMRLFQAIGIHLKSGPYLSEFLNLLQASEAACLGQLEGIEATDRRRREIVFRYLLVGVSPRSLGITHLANGVRSVPRGAPWSGPARGELLSRLASPEEQDMGVLYLLCEFCRENLWTERDESVFDLLPGLLRVCAASGNYYLILDACWVAESASHHISEPLSREIQAILESLLGDNVMLNSTVLETLSRYTTLDVGVTADSAIREIREILAGPRSPELNERAAQIFYSQFEEIYQGVYYEAIQNLESESSLEFLIRAALGSDEFVFFLSSVLRRLIDFDSDEAIPAFEHWTSPRENSGLMLDEIGGVFTLSHIGLARLAANLPEIDAAMDSNRVAWSEWGKIIYWAHREDLTEHEKKRGCEISWHKLLGELKNEAVDPWFWVERYRVFDSSVGIELNVVENLFPFEVKALLEFGLENSKDLGSMFSFPVVEERDRLIISALGRLGDEKTAILLEQLADSENLGLEAVNAIREIRRNLREQN